MTSYFDAKGAELAKLRGRIECEDWDTEAQDLLRALEESVVGDVLVCSAMPGFPEAVRDAIDRTILKYGLNCLPLGVTSPANDGFDFYRTIENLISDLHGHFHDLARMELPGFSDNPIVPIRILIARGEDRIHELAVKTGRARPPKVEDNL